MIDLFREVAEPSRRTILSELKAGSKNVGELVRATGLKQPNVSNHLAKLRARGLVRANKVGRQVFYSLANPEVANALGGLLAPEPEAPECVTLDGDTAKVYAKAAIAGDEAGCTRLVDSLIRQGAPLVRVYYHLFTEALKLIGKWCDVDAIDEGQEHLAIGITERMMARVIQYAGPVQPNGMSVVLGCSEGNWHSIALRMVSDVMRLNGWHTLYMGPNVPTRAFLSSVRDHRPSAVLVSCQSEANADGCAETLKALQEIRDQREVTFMLGAGGAAVVKNPQRYVDAGADFTAADLMVFSEEVLPRMEHREHAPIGIFTNSKKLD